MSIDEEIEKAEQVVRDLRAKKLGLPVGWHSSTFDNNVAYRKLSDGSELRLDTKRGAFQATVSFEVTVKGRRDHESLGRQAENALIERCRAIIKELEGT